MVDFRVLAWALRGTTEVVGEGGSRGTVLVGVVVTTTTLTVHVKGGRGGGHNRGGFRGGGFEGKGWRGLQGKGGG